MKVSLITVVYNAQQFIANCIESIIAQDYKEIEYIVIDGGSTDGTLQIIKSYQIHIEHLVSERDHGMYDALNKGITLASGDIIGILNADDMLASADVISAIVKAFQKSNTDGVYGNLNYIHPNTNQVLRKWVSKPFAKKDIENGWMPAHPTLYLKRALFNQYGGYSLDYGTAADYELMLRFLYRYEVKAVFIDKLLVNMRNGGMSNATVKQRYHALINDFKALKSNKVNTPVKAIFLKKFSKLVQFL